MRSLLFILPLILGACNDNVITNTTGSGGDPDPTAQIVTGKLETKLNL